MDDEVAGFLLSRWCQNSLLWASDYPHANGVWPKSREVIARTLGHLPANARAGIVGLNTAKLYNKPVPPLMEPPAEGIDESQWTERATMLESARK
jgi:hypothetical protein